MQISWQSSLFALFALAAAQAPAGGPPSCGVSCVLPDIASSGCAKGDWTCVCKIEKVVSDIKTCVPTKCKGAELKGYETWVNDVCKGVAGWPVTLGAAKRVRTRRDAYVQMQ
ncbi:putative RING finger and WD repeat-containing protein [Venturia nashicola]|uniref:Putative RING finger and WD repeat-containing protein n=1 Tax=Venturia nashicola TaxID=86259 RepID=A0A4Z1PBK9_9PEZI|nr:putative RING finger and WD repeat-containing protein [Venturia nashicola]TLD38097.1 putative RING finger and WD repeat-containing protein [Venturia nashicola]